MSFNITRSIKKISVRKLFGKFDYDIGPLEDREENNRIIILYGDNGSGKTTILKLAFHLLAPEDKEGHKSVAVKIPFRSFEIEFTDGTKVNAFRPEKELKGSFVMELKRPRKKRIIAEFIAVKPDSCRAASEENEKQINKFLEALHEMELSLYMLSDDRTIQLAGRMESGSSMYELPFDENAIFIESESRSQIMGRPKINPEYIAQNLLTQSMRRTEAWIRRSVMLGSSAGDYNVNVLYNQILARLTTTQQQKQKNFTKITKQLIQRILNLEKRCGDLAQYGLLPEFNGKEILKVIESSGQSNIDIIYNVLTPYLESIEKKLEAMAEIYTRINAFVNIINSFLTGKRLSLSVHEGMNIMSAGGYTLEPQMLSSGERHLMLLFCNSIIAVEHPSLLMIDEPEISLNIKWQRKLLSSLSKCIADSPVQYVFATHSIELLTQHRNSVVKLDHITNSKG